MSTATLKQTSPTLTPDAVPNRFLSAADWADPRYTHLRRLFDSIYRDELAGAPHPAHAKHPDKIVTHWSREWEYPWAVLNAELTPRLRCVDLGCGGSPLIPYLVTRGKCECAGVDLNLRSSAGHTLRGFPLPPEKAFPQVNWVTRSMADTGLDDGAWDRVFCISVLEHVGETLAAETFCEIRRLLAEPTPGNPTGGLAIITTDVDGAHRTLDIDYRRLITLAGEAGLLLRGRCDFTRPPAPTADHPGTYDVVGLVFAV